MNNEIFAAERIKQFIGLLQILRAPIKPDYIFQYTVQMITALTEKGLKPPQAIQQDFLKTRKTSSE